MLFNLLGFAGIGGVIGMAILVPINLGVSRVYSKYQKRLLGWRDKRMRLLNEASFFSTFHPSVFLMNEFLSISENYL
jgi:hypothetical protein